MSNIKFRWLIFSLLFISIAAAQSPDKNIIIAVQPAFNAISEPEYLYENAMVNTSGYDQTANGWIKIDGKTKRFMGNDAMVNERIPQVQKTVKALSTEYIFRDDKIQLTINFLSPLLFSGDDYEQKPVCYVSFSIEAVDDKPHNVQLYAGFGANWISKSPTQDVVCSYSPVSELSMLTMGTANQQLLKTTTNEGNTDWGYMHIGYQTGVFSYFIGNLQTAQQYFLKGWNIQNDELTSTGKIPAPNAGLALVFDAGEVQYSTVQNYFSVFFEDMYSVEYQKQKLSTSKERRFSAKKQLIEIVNDYNAQKQLFGQLDNEWTKKYPEPEDSIFLQQCHYAYRKELTNIVKVYKPNGKPLVFHKSKDGKINSIDAMFDVFPLLLTISTETAAGLLEPVFMYRENARWFEPYPPSNLGNYPLANHPVSITAKRIEDASKMLIMTAGIVNTRKAENYALLHWRTLGEYAQWIVEQNVSLKEYPVAAIALNAYRKMAIHLNKKEEAFAIETYIQKSTDTFISATGVQFRIPETAISINNKSKRLLLVDNAYGIQTYADSLYVNAATGITANNTVLFLRHLTDGFYYGEDENTDFNPAKKINRLFFMKDILSVSEHQRQTWRYSLEIPSGKWWENNYDDEKWEEALAPFASDSITEIEPKTAWNTNDIWLRKTFEMETGNVHDLRLRLLFDHEIEVFINGIPAARIYQPAENYQIFDVDRQALKTIKKGTNTIAIHTTKKQNPQFVDAGLIMIVGEK